MKRIILTIIISSATMMGCTSVRAYKSESGRYLELRGKGEATFADGSSIKSGGALIEIPKVEIDN